MSLMDRIYDIGGMLRVIHVEPASKPEMPPKITTRTYTLAQLMGEIADRDVRALAGLPAELSVAFDEIFDAAGVPRPAHGWNVEKLRDLLATAEFASLEGEALTAAVTGRFDRDGASTEDLARDAIGRDQAIDAFEEFAREKMTVRRDARRRRVAELRAEIERLETEAARLEEEAAVDRREWRAWHKRKTDYEKMMAGALSCLLDKPIVTLDPDEE